jgi:exopolyphosphatase / guanosine-5'-triphosphate,3'-diphosphate pyrophosphatase
MNQLTSLHIGASSVSLLIAEKNADNTIKPIDFLEQPAPLAHDIFGNGIISTSTTERVVSIIKGYQKNLAELGFHTSNLTRSVTTNILPEASNYNIFLNRIRIACGIHLDPIDDGEMTRLIYLKTRRRLKDTPTMKQNTTLVIHIGPGNTRALLFKKGEITRYTSYRLGTHRMREAVSQSNAEGHELLRLIRENASVNIEQIRVDYEQDSVETLVIIGYEIQLISPLFIKNGQAFSTKKLRSIINEAASLSQYDLVKTFRLDYHTAEAFLPALQISLACGEILNLTEIHVPVSEYEQGILTDLLISKTLVGTFEKEVIRAAQLLARRYHSDPRHGEHVSKICSHLFSQLQHLHQLGPHEELLLHTAAILHEVGSYISPRSHHKHSEYIILNSEIFGLDRLDITLVALIARYHRHSCPKTDHLHYSDLSIDDRIRVCKLASILRVADALERTHHQRVNEIKIKLTDDKMILHLTGVAEATVENLAMYSKADLFTQTFGLQVIIETD